MRRSGPRTIHRGNAICVVAEERLPALRRRPSPAHHYGYGGYSGYGPYDYDYNSSGPNYYGGPRYYYDRPYRHWTEF
jgi:hypothetical protein